MPTFRELAELVLNEREEDGIRGINKERNRFKVHVATAPFVDKPIDQVHQVDLVEWSREMQRKKAKDRRGDRTLSRFTIQRSMALVSAVFGSAMDRGLVASNPSIGLRVRRGADRVSPEKWTYLTVDEQRAFATCETVPKADRYAILFALYTGLRQGEQFNLHLEDLHVDDDNPFVHVKFGSSGFPPKNGRARRVPLVGEGLKVARAWLKMLPTYAPRNPDSLVFPTASGARRGVGKPLGRKRVESKWVCAWKWAVKEVDIERNVRWHDLRHSCASSLLAGWWGRRWSTEEIRELLGHSSIKISERYAHLGHDSIQEAARATRLEDGPAQVRRYVWLTKLRRRLHSALAKAKEVLRVA